MARTLTNSNTFKERAKKVVPHLTGTFSRAAPSYVEGVFLYMFKMLMVHILLMSMGMNTLIM